MNNDPYSDDVKPLLESAIQSGDSAGLESYLLKNQSPSLLTAFAQAVGEVCVRPDPPVEYLESLLDGWAAHQDAESIALVVAAVVAYGRVAIVRPDWWGDETGKLREAPKI